MLYAIIGLVSAIVMILLYSCCVVAGEDDERNGRK